MIVRSAPSRRLRTHWRTYIPASRGETDWQKLVGGRDDYIANINRHWDGHVTDRGITRIDGTARFADACTVEVGGRRYSAEHIVIATGGRHA